MKDLSRVLDSALPLFLEGTNSKAVLVLHGYTGYPGEMYEVARRINVEGYTVVVPRLPGHGTNGRDFRKTGWKLWYNHVRNEYLNLRSRYEWVAVAGLSMGGVLSLLIAAEFSPQKAVLLAPAMLLNGRLLYLTPLLKFFIPRIARKQVAAPETDEDREILAREYWSYFFTATLSSLCRLIRMAKKRLSDVVCPVYIMLSEKDESVPPGAGEIIENGVCGRVEKMILKNSPHVFFEGPENEIVIERIIDWLNEEK